MNWWWIFIMAAFHHSPRLNYYNCAVKLFPNPSSPDLAPTDYYLVPNKKKALAETKFSSNDEIIGPTNAYTAKLHNSYFLEKFRKFESYSIKSSGRLFRYFKRRANYVFRLFLHEHIKQFSYVVFYYFFYFLYFINHH